MERDDLIREIASLLADGKDDIVELALRKAEEEIQERENLRIMEESGLTEMEEGEEDDGEMQDTQVNQISDALARVRDMCAPMEKPIPVLPIPTPYGVGLLVDMMKYMDPEENAQLKEMLRKDFSFLPVKIGMIGASVNMESSGVRSECLEYRQEYEDGPSTLGLLMPKQAVNMKYGYVFPTVGFYMGMGMVGSSMEDTLNGINCWVGSTDEKLLELPAKGCVVDRENAYQEGTLYRNGEGCIHFISDPSGLERPLQGNAVPLVVQAGCQTDKESGTTDSIIVLHRLSWDDIDEICD